MPSPSSRAAAFRSENWAWDFTTGFASSLFSSAGWKAVGHSFGEGGCDRLMFETFAGDFNPFPGDPSPTDAIEPAMKFGAAYNYSKALGYAASRGLTYPSKSKVFQGIIGKSEAFEAATPYLQVGGAGAHALYTAGSAVYNGECH